ncbi:TVP38/TMEM64 family protein [Methylobacterium adhaesivum]|uniref:TVP38/TMEM64 family membrane protein n=1 Tax=Methylobacterium adhaesivum TaxID=333297 RepID=A0ABT8BIE0_9HYPH|nr:VTT domain-containing protein [Methylobacterium adhaesivum]MDN3591275.1 VTT domain-containing protein [Methylobacterium adhaesivum]
MTSDETDGADAPRARWRRVLRWLPIAAMIATSLAILASGITRLLDLDTLLASRAWLSDAVARNPTGAMAAAILAYVGAVVVSVPATLFLTVLCGFLFGIVPGALIAVASASMGAAIVFSIGRGPASELLRRRAGPRLAGLAEGFRRDAFGYITFLRLLPIFPFWLTNLAPAAFGVSLRTFFLATILGLTPGALVYATTGAAIEEVVATHEAALAACALGDGTRCGQALTLRSLITPTMLAGLAALAAFALLSVLLRRRLAREHA